MDPREEILWLMMVSLGFVFIGGCFIGQMMLRLLHH